MTVQLKTVGFIFAIDNVAYFHVAVIIKELVLTVISIFIFLSGIPYHHIGESQLFPLT